MSSYNIRISLYIYICYIIKVRYPCDQVVWWWPVSLSSPSSVFFGTARGTFQGSLKEFLCFDDTSARCQEKLHLSLRSKNLLCFRGVAVATWDFRNNKCNKGNQPEIGSTQLNSTSPLTRKVSPYCNPKTEVTLVPFWARKSEAQRGVLWTGVVDPATLGPNMD